MLTAVNASADQPYATGSSPKRNSPKKRRGDCAGHVCIGIQPVFKMLSKTAMMMREDLEAGRDAWLEEAPPEKVRKEREKTSFLKYRDAAGRVADFHALRHTYISRLVRSGAGVKVAQELARHSTPTLTLGRYAHVQLVDQTRALDALPAIDSSEQQRKTMRATGTDDALPPC